MSHEPFSPALQPSRRASFILSIWSESQPNAQAAWRGYLETPSGKRAYFDLLAELSRLLQDVGGWHDPPGEA